MHYKTLHVKRGKVKVKHQAAILVSRSVRLFVLYFLYIFISFTFASPRHKTVTRILRCYKTRR